MDGFVSIIMQNKRRITNAVKSPVSDNLSTSVYDVKITRQDSTYNVVRFEFYVKLASPFTHMPTYLYFVRFTVKLSCYMLFCSTIKTSF